MYFSRGSIVFVALSLCLYSAFGVEQELPGTYEMSGSTSATGSLYRGFVKIEANGSNYKLTWKIGENQTQIGIGILDGNILSVGFGDPGQQSFGVVSYKLVGKGYLKGKWSFIGGGFCWVGRSEAYG